MKTETHINNELIRKFSPCYEPKTVTESERESLPVTEWVAKYRDKVNSESDIIWLLCRKEFLSDRDLRLFAVWCARESYQYCTEQYPINQRSIDAVDCAERFANGEANELELSAAWSAARSAASSAATQTPANSAPRAAATRRCPLCAATARADSSPQSQPLPSAHTVATAPKGQKLWFQT